MGAMNNETLITLAADIVGAHVSNNAVATADVASLIRTVFVALQWPQLIEGGKFSPCKSRDVE